MTDEEMVATLTAKGYHIKAPVDQATCKHIARTGTGWAKSDGSSGGNYHCPECGKSWIESTAPMPQKPFDLRDQPHN